MYEVCNEILMYSDTNLNPGHNGAVEAGVLHRDVSINNILIDIETGKGFLNDWDMAIYLQELIDGSTQHGRVVSYYVRWSLLY